MKIAFFSAFYPYRGGIAQFSAMLLRAMEGEHEVKAVTFKRQYPGILFPGTTQYVTEEDNADKIDAVRKLDSINPITFRSTAKEIKSFEPDLFVSHYWMTFFGPAMAGIHKRLGKNVKRICIIHNLIPHEKRFFDKPANRMFLKHNDGFVVMNNVVLEDLLSLKPDAKYLRINHPVYDQFGAPKKRLDALAELGLKDDKKYLLFFGMIRGYKGLDLLINALTHLPEDYNVIVAGEVYGSFDSYESLIKEKELAHRIHLFNNYIPDSEVTTYFSAADVCVLPYKSATQSGITAVSYHFNLPIVATDVGGLKENTKHMETGLIVERPDSELIARSIQQYFDEGLRVEMEKNIIVEKENNSWEKFAERLVEFSKTL